MATVSTAEKDPVGQRFLLVKEAASALGVSSMTLYRMIQAKQFPALRVGSRWLVPAGAVGELTASSIPPLEPLGPNLVDVPVVARVLRVAPATLYRLIHAGGFPAVWLRGRVLVPGGVIDEMSTAAMAARAAIDPTDWISARRPDGDEADGTTLLRAGIEK